MASQVLRPPSRSERAGRLGGRRGGGAGVWVVGGLGGEPYLLMGAGQEGRRRAKRTRAQGVRHRLKPARQRINSVPESLSAGWTWVAGTAVARHHLMLTDFQLCAPGLWG